MTTNQLLILAIGFITVAMFLWGRWRHDMVAVGSLLASVLTGLVPAREAFSGFGHPAVITVACVLVLSRGLLTSGAIDALTRTVIPSKSGMVMSMASLIGLGALLSSFMNNVGAMAMLMPVAMQLAKRFEIAPGRVLMPLAFGTIFGGMTTLIGTPPNLIVAGFRAETEAGSFAMFDFAPVGLTVAVTGVIFIIMIGWRLVPSRQHAGIEGFESGAYITEAHVPDNCKAVGMNLGEIDAILDENGSQVIGMVHNGIRLTAPQPRHKVRAGDILIIEAEPEALSEVLSILGLKLEDAIKDVGNNESHNSETDRSADGVVRGQKNTETINTGKGRNKDEEIRSGDIVLVEIVVLPGSPLSGRSTSDILLGTRYGLNLLALSRQGKLSLKRLRSINLRPGDLLLIQGSPEAISEFSADYGCVPLAERELRIPNRRKAWEAGIIMVLAVGVVAFGLLPATISFALGVLVSMALRTVPPRIVYEAIDWPVIVLLGALIPFAGAMESTGTAGLIAHFMLYNLAQGHAVAGLIMILVISMFLSDLMNNAATATVMCPIAIGTSAVLGVSADPFLMAVAIGASCAFLTPIGHQNNTLILGPGGFRFGDYWKLGLPLEIIVLAISVPLLLVVWPL